jgi:CHASE3 domain sensor protein
MTYKLATKQAAYYYIAIILIIALGIVFYFNSKKVITSDHQVTHTYSVMDKNQELLVEVLNFETAGRGYFITGNEKYIADFNQSIKSTEEHLSVLLKLTQKNPSQNKRVQDLKVLIDKRIQLSQDLINTNNKSSKEYNELQTEIKQTVAEIKSYAAAQEKLQTRTNSLIASTNKQKLNKLNEIESDFVSVFFFSFFIYFNFKLYNS